ncbi:MAG: alpha/beta hydrolase [Lacunisphaera sp.]|nr:alpha/beta hydrolase [Lacunisphaera sp.]
MKNTLRLVCALLLPVGLLAQLTPPKLDIPYGHNPAAGKFAEVNGIKLYYESYGTGRPMLQIHGNGGDIQAMGHQLKFFSTHYRVIAADSRGQGQSGLGTDHLTYEQIAEDLNALLDQLGVKSADIFGWSDGGIVGLLLAIHHPDKVGKLAIMGANLRPDGAYAWAEDAVAKQNTLVDEMIAKGDKTQPWAVQKQLLDLLGQQPNIPVSDLRKISAPVLVMAGDKDVIKDEHTLEIFHNLAQAHLCIFPGATHMIAWDNPALLNSTLETFFSKPYTRPDTKDIFQ